MESSNSVYQRAVTPTMDSASAGGGIVRGRMLSYQASQLRRTLGAAKGEGSVTSGSSVGGSHSAPRQGSQQLLGSSAVSSKQGVGGQQQPQRLGAPNDFNIQGRSASSGVPSLGGIGGNSIKSMAVGGMGVGSATSYNTSIGGLPAVPGSVNRHSGGSDMQSADHGGAAQSLASLPRYDLYPLSDEIPTDGIIFAKVRNQADSLVVFRTPEERLRNPERLNLDRRQLDACPLLEQEQRLRLLNFQNNNIRAIQNLENLPNLIFLDIYNNKLTSLEGPLSTVKGLRVLMVGKNRIATITNLSCLRKLDVLDLHSNEIRQIDGLDGLTDLRVLNLAGNRISTVQNLASLQALTELNLRRNSIERVHELDKLPALQRIFLSHNLLVSIADIKCLFSVKFLVELSLDGNPLSESDPTSYRCKIVAGMSGLKHLDLKRITESERTQSIQLLSAQQSGQADPHLVETSNPNDKYTVENSAGTSTAHGGEQWGLSDGEIPSNLPELLCGDKATLAARPDEPISKQTTEASKASNDSHAPSGLAALARAGRIASSSHSVFDLEVRRILSLCGRVVAPLGVCSLINSFFKLVAPNEKALIAVGDAWEWVQAKRLLVNVVEASLYHMKKEVVISKFSSNISFLPALKCLRLVNNEIETLREFGTVAESLGRMSSTIEHLIIIDNPVCASSTLLRSYACALLPNLKSFNDVEISVTARQESSKMIAPIIKIQDQAAAQQFSVALGGGMNSLLDGVDNLAELMTPGRPNMRKTNGPAKRPVGAMGQRNTGTAALENFEAGIDQLVRDISAQSIAGGSLRTKFDDAFSKSMQIVFKEAVLALTNNY